jgi:hypothetical protein
VIECDDTHKALAKVSLAKQGHHALLIGAIDLHMMAVIFEQTSVTNPLQPSVTVDFTPSPALLLQRA